MQRLSFIGNILVQYGLMLLSLLIGIQLRLYGLFQFSLKDSCLYLIDPGNVQHTAVAVMLGLFVLLALFPAISRWAKDGCDYTSVSWACERLKREVSHLKSIRKLILGFIPLLTFKQCPSLMSIVFGGMLSFAFHGNLHEESTQIEEFFFILSELTKLFVFLFAAMSFVLVELDED